MREKSIVKNAVFNVLYRILNMFFPLVTSIYVSHVLLAEGVGKVSSAQNIVQYFILLAPLGISNYGIREIAKRRADKEEADKIFTELVIINSISTSICVLVYYGLIFFHPAFRSERNLYLAAGLPVILNYINIDWYYKGYEEYVYISIRSALIKLISLAAILIFVRKKEDYVYYALIYSFGIVGNYIFNVLNLRKKKIRFTFTTINCVQHLRYLLVLLFSCIAIELYTLLDTTMLSFQCSEKIVGLYSNSIKLERIIVELIAAIGGVLLPRLSYYHKYGREKEAKKLVETIITIMYSFAFPCAAGIFVLADVLIPLLFGNSFTAAVITVRLGTPLIFVLGFSHLFGTQILLTYGQEMKLLISTLVGAGSNIMMNMILIPVYKNNGAIIASVISESLVTLLTMIFSKQYLKFKVDLSDMMKIIIAGMIMGCGVFVIKNIIIIPIFTLLLCVAVGVIIFGVINLVLQTSIYQLIGLSIEKYIKKS